MKIGQCGAAGCRSQWIQRAARDRSRNTAGRRGRPGGREEARSDSGSVVTGESRAVRQSWEDMWEKRCSDEGSGDDQFTTMVLSMRVAVLGR
jgi:hypothetical protein